jgi:hypothetical protein
MSKVTLHFAANRTKPFGEVFAKVKLWRFNDDEGESFGVRCEKPPQPSERLRREIGAMSCLS